MFDMEKYLAEKADKLGFGLERAHYTLNADARCFLLRKHGIVRPITISGLEEIQNGSDECMKDLLDARFADASAKLIKATQ